MFKLHTSSFLQKFKSNNSKPSTKEIFEAVNKIKTLCRTEENDNGQRTQKNIQGILLIMKTYSSDIRVQRIGCHSLSNLAMNITNATYIIQNEGFAAIKTALENFLFDHKLCWLASSALWNLSRPPQNRAIIGDAGVKLMFKVLYTHMGNEQVINTSVGALSNLSLNDALKDLIAQPKNLSTLLSVVEYALLHKNILIITSASGLLANLAVSDSHASTLVEKGALKHMINVLQDESIAQADETLRRNICAAMNNVVTAEHFIQSFLENKGIEAIYKFLANNQQERMYAQLLHNCLHAVDPKFEFENLEEVTEEEEKTEETPKKQTTSFHMASQHGKLSIIKQLIEENPHIDLDGQDGYGVTALDYAVLQKHTEIVQFLAKCGAKKSSEMIAASKTEIALENEQILAAYQQGHQTLKQVQKERATSIEISQSCLPTELAGLITSFSCNIDMLSAVRQL